MHLPDLKLCKLRQLQFLRTGVALGASWALGMGALAFAPAAQADPADELPLLEIVTAAGDQDDPAAVFNQRGRRFLVVYDDNSDDQVKGRFVTPDPPFQSGEVVLGPIFTISENPGDEVDEPALAVSKRGTFLVVWEQFDEDLDADVLAVALLNQNGAALEGPFIVPVECDADSPNVAYNEDDDEWLVVWQQDPFPGDDCQDAAGIKGVIVSGDAAQVGAVFDISEAGVDAFDPDVAYDTRNGEFLVVYVFSEDINEVFGQRVATDGALLGDPIEIAADTDIGNDDPVVVFDQTRRQSLVVWRHGSDDGDDRIEARFVPAGGGEPLGDRFFVSNAAGEPGGDPALEFRSNRYLAIWDTSTFDDPPTSDMFGQSVSRDGDLIGGNFALANEADLFEDAPADVHLNLACANNQVCLALWLQIPPDDEGFPDDGESDIAGRLLFQQP